jgi:hypothetical protein
MGRTSNNRVYLVSCLRHFTQIPFQGTSDMRQPLYEMATYESL